MPFDNPEAEVELNDVTLRLIEARARIEKGWMQGQYKERGSYCALGALNVSDMDADPLQVSCIFFLEKSLPGAAGSAGSPSVRIAIYNDVPNRDKSEIIDLFDRAIANSMNCG